MSPPPIAHQRAEGAAELRFGPDAAGRTTLRHLFQAAPLRVLFPTPEPGEPPLAALVNTAGGLAGGDALRFEAVLEAGACATLTTPAAEKLYRSLGPDTRVRTTLRLGPGSVLEWLPQETILFDGARLHRGLDLALEPQARLLAAEMLVFGRTARGETFSRGFLHDGWRLRRNGVLRWADALRLEDPGAAGADRFGLNGAGALATLVYAADGAEALLPVLRDSCGAFGAATLPRPGVLLARWLGPATPLRAAVGGAITAMRSVALGLPARLPRLWTT